MTTELPEVLGKVETDLQTIGQAIEGFQVLNPEQEKECIEYLGAIKQRKKRVETLRKEFTGPLNDQVKKINNMFRGHTDQLDSMDAHLRTTLKVYMDAEEAKRREEERKAIEKKRKEDEEARKKAEELRKEAEAVEDEEKKKAMLLKAQEEDLKPMQTVAEVAPAKVTVRATESSATRKTVWKWKITNKTKAIEAHPDLFEVISPEVNKLMRQGVRDLPGFEFYEESQIAIR